MPAPASLDMPPPDPPPLTTSGPDSGDADAGGHRSGESARSRWSRRAVTIPSMLGATALALVLAPLIAAGLVLADLARGRRRLPRLRVYLVVLQYLVNDSIEIILAPLLWVAAGFGTRLDSRASRRRHARLQLWSADVLARRADRLLGLRIDVHGEAALTPAPAVLLSRHVSLLDASLPGLLYDRDAGYDLRGVIMAELLSDPGFDLLYGRLGSIFVDRSDGDTARRRIRELGETLDERSVAVIFPEGRLSRPDVRERALARLAETDPARAARLGDLRHLLPPRAGGVQSLLDGAPDADVVIVNHVGFESAPSLAALSRRAPLDHSIEVWVRRIDRRTIPSNDDARAAWLDAEWSTMDHEIEQRLAPAGRSDLRASA